MEITALEKITASPVLGQLYKALCTNLDHLGEYEVEVKKTSLHITHSRAFLGVHPRKDSLLLNIVTSAPLNSARLHKVDRVSANRYHNEVIISDTQQFDTELSEWLGQAYSLTS